MNTITTAIASALLGITSLSPSLTSAGSAGNFNLQTQPTGTDFACVAEASAYAEVADLAYLYREDGEVFATAIEDLRDQLLDCLATFDHSDERSLSPAAGDRLKLI